MDQETAGRSERTARRRAVGAYASADARFLGAGLAALGPDVPPANALRGPEVGLVMLRGRIGGGGAPFNLGEASVTRASVRLPAGQVGHSVVIGRDTDKARLAAHLDALWQDPAWRARVEETVVGPALAAEAEADRRLAEETQATRVDFFTLARGED